jgi:hypothetical protein
MGPTTVGVILFRLLVEPDSEAEAEDETGKEVVAAAGIAEVAAAVAVAVAVAWRGCSEGFEPSVLISPAPPSESLMVTPLLGAGSSGVSAFKLGSVPDRSLGSSY